MRGFECVDFPLARVAVLADEAVVRSFRFHGRYLLVKNLVSLPPIYYSALNAEKIRQTGRKNFGKMRMIQKRN